KVAEGPGILSGNKELYFTVEDAGGLVKNSSVKMAGIKVGVIDEIELVDGKARVHLLLEGDVPVTTSSKVELRSDGILGDKHVEIVPGNPLDQKMATKTEIAVSPNANGLDSVMKEIGKITTSLNKLADNLNKATSGEGDPSTPVGRIILNVESLTKDLSEVTSDNKEKINNIIARVESLTRNLDNYINQESLARVDKSIRNIEEITNKINDGEGTIGRLINDDQTVEEINTAVAKVNEFLGGAEKLEMSIDFHSEYLSDVDLTKSYLGVKIKPGLDRYYDVQVIDDPRGVVRATKTETNLGPTEEKTVTFYNKIKLTALFAKNFYNFTVKGGLIENTGGVAFDYHLFNKQLTLSTEFFDFDDLYIRTFARYNFFEGVYIIGGGDNLLSAGETDFSGFIGAGIFITNDDLKTLASMVKF
ncbi:MAG: MCE family protein, partial [Bdellovibrionales bacterium]|nr:MCE family protein [Bdellovibrionales bacterium]